MLLASTAVACLVKSLHYLSLRNATNNMSITLLVNICRYHRSKQDSREGKKPSGVLPLDSISLCEIVPDRLLPDSVQFAHRSNLLKIGFIDSTTPRVLLIMAPDVRERNEWLKVIRLQFPRANATPPLQHYHSGIQIGKDSWTCCKCDGHAHRNTRPDASHQGCCAATILGGAIQKRNPTYASVGSHRESQSSVVSEHVDPCVGEKLKKSLQESAQKNTSEIEIPYVTPAGVHVADSLETSVGGVETLTRYHKFGKMPSTAYAELSPGHERDPATTNGYSKLQFKAPTSETSPHIATSSFDQIPEVDSTSKRFVEVTTSEAQYDYFTEDHTQKRCVTADAGRWLVYDMPRDVVKDALLKCEKGSFVVRNSQSDSDVGASVLCVRTSTGIEERKIAQHEGNFLIFDPGHGVRKFPTLKDVVEWSCDAMYPATAAVLACASSLDGRRTGSDAVVYSDGSSGEEVLPS